MKTNVLSFLSLCLFAIACSNTKGISSGKNNQVSGNAFIVTEISTDETYGYTQKNAVKVGGAMQSSGPLNEQRFLNALAGPNGEAITYERQGSCCPFDSKNGFMGGGLLDIYIIKWNGQSKPATIYINMYDPGDLKIPVGFTAKK